MSKNRKPRTKKGTGSTIARKMSGIFMRDTAIIQLNAEPLHLLDMSTMKINHRPSHIRKHAIMNDRHRWTVGLLLFTTERNNKKKMVIEQLNFGSANNYEVLCDSLILTHREMIQEWDSKVPIESLGVISTPNYKFDLIALEQEIDKVFCELGCYEKTINKMMNRSK